MADRGYFKFEDIQACEAAGITACVPKAIRGLTHSNDNPMSPAFYVMASSLVMLITMIWVKETAFEPLQ